MTVPQSHIDQANALFVQINEASKGRPIPAVVEACSQVIRACLRDVPVDQRREYIRLIDEALTATLLDSSAPRGMLQ